MVWFLLVVVGIAIYFQKGVTSSTVMLLIWGSGIIASLCYYTIDILPRKGIVYLLLCCLLFFASNNFFMQLHLKKRGFSFIHRDIVEFDFDKMSSAVFITVTIEILMIVIYVVEHGYYNSSFFSITTVIRNEEIGIRSLFSKLSVPFVLAVIAIDGYLMIYAKSIKKKFKSRFLIYFTGVIVLGILSTSKMFILQALFFWCGGILCAFEEYYDRIESKRAIIDLILKNKKTVVLGISVIIIVFAFTLYSRSLKSVNEIVDIFFNYAVGQYPCFSIWYENINVSELQYSYGGQTFYGILKQFNILSGLSDNWALNTELMQKGIFSNIYTVFRGIIEDFGIVGSIIFWGIFGAISGTIEKLLPIVNKTCFYSASLLMIYLVIFYSLFISAFHYTTPLIGVIMFGIMLYYAKYMRVKKYYKIRLK